jgi:hypothetical protein
MDVLRAPETAMLPGPRFISKVVGFREGVPKLLVSKSQNAHPTTASVTTIMQRLSILL